MLFLHVDLSATVWITVFLEPVFSRDGGRAFHCGQACSSARFLVIFINAGHLWFEVDKQKYDHDEKMSHMDKYERVSAP